MSDLATIGGPPLCAVEAEGTVEADSEPVTELGAAGEGVAGYLAVLADSHYYADHILGWDTLVAGE